MKILCVEDGSVDLESFDGKFRDDKVLVYRQGSKPPFVLEITQENLAKDIKEFLLKLKIEMCADIDVENVLHNEHTIEVLKKYLSYVEKVLGGIDANGTNDN